VIRKSRFALQSGAHEQYYPTDSDVNKKVSVKTYARWAVACLGSALLVAQPDAVRIALQLFGRFV
jgi:hypothetical protein